MSVKSFFSNKAILYGMGAMLVGSLFFSPLIILPKVIMYLAMTAAVFVGMARLSGKGLKSFFGASGSSPKQNKMDSKKSEELDKAMEKMGNGKDIEDPAVKALIGKLRDNGLTVTTNWTVANQILEALPEKYSHLRDNSGEVRGFVYKGKIFINPDKADLSVPVHEYTHIWAEAYRQNNPEEWRKVVELLKKETQLWDSVKQSYPYLDSDDEIADEVLATYSGAHGKENLEKFLSGDTKPRNAFKDLFKALEVFWGSVAKLFDCKFEHVEDVSDRVMYDLLKGIDPGKYINKNVMTLSDNKPLSAVGTGMEKPDAPVAEHVANVSGVESAGNQQVNDRLPYEDIVKTYSDGKASVFLFKNAGKSPYGYENVGTQEGRDALDMIARHIDKDVVIDHFEDINDFPTMLKFSSKEKASKFLSEYSIREEMAFESVGDRTYSSQRSFTDDQVVYVKAYLQEYGGFDIAKREKAADFLLTVGLRQHFEDNETLLPEWKEQTRDELLQIARDVNYSHSQGLKL